MEAPLFFTLSIVGYSVQLFRGFIHRVWSQHLNYYQLVNLMLSPKIIL